MKLCTVDFHASISKLDCRFLGQKQHLYDLAIDYCMSKSPKSLNLLKLQVSHFRPKTLDGKVKFPTYHCLSLYNYKL